MKYCPTCGCECDDDTNYCPGCGTLINTSEERSCPFCGAKNTLDAKFCAKCGAKFNAPLPDQSNNIYVNKMANPIYRSRRRDPYLQTYDIKTLIMGIAGIVLAIVSFFIFGFLSFIGLILGVLCIIFAAMAPREDRRDVPGLVLGIVGATLNLIGVILYIIILVAIALG